MKRLTTVNYPTILKLLDQVAYACASRYSGSYVVTLSVDKVNFKDCQIKVLMIAHSKINNKKLYTFIIKSDYFSKKKN